MKNGVFVFFVMLILFSCKEEKIEFVQSRAIPALILIKNPPKSDSLLKSQLVNFLIKNQPKKEYIFIDILGIQVILLKIKKIQMVVFLIMHYMITQKMILLFLMSINAGKIPQNWWVVFISMVMLD